MKTEPPAEERPKGRRRLPGVNLRPGSVKQARLEARLSLAQLGKGHVTAPAIYLVETGRTRPSMPTLEHIARQTGKPVEFFLADPEGGTDETQSALIELELLVASGRSADALALGQKLLDMGSSAHRLGRIRFLLAQANLQESRFDAAGKLLAGARSHFEAVNDDLMLAECLGAGAALANLTHGSAALGLAEEALALCRTLKPVPVPVEVRLLGILANALIGNREWDRAVACYEEAIQAAGAITELPQAAEMYAGLSTAYREAGQVEAANRYAARAAALFEVAADRRSVADAESNLGLIYMTKGEQAAAREHVERARVLSAGSAVAGGSSQVLISLSELSLQENNPSQAMDFARQALDTAERAGDRANQAEARVRIGLAAESLGDAELVDREFERAISGLEGLSMNERLLQCHRMYAEVLERRGDLNRAYAHMKKAVMTGRPGVLPRDEEEERAGTA
ncbi:MAG TPA: helix-turn-helix transcriptional regulator [Patescibacteria group bacterium]|nr:helix-turn-helix transcriptional regulator [Patescibacteria group bacterium]